MQRKRATALLAAITIMLAGGMMACGTTGNNGAEDGTSAGQEAQSTSADSGDTGEAQETADEEESSGEEGVGGVFEKDIDAYQGVLKGLPESSYYAFIDLSDDYDALLVAKDKDVYDDGEGGKAASSAQVYGLDADRNPVKLAKVKGGGTDAPLACADHFLFKGGKNMLYKLAIDEESGQLVGKEGVLVEYGKDGSETYYTGPDEDHMTEAADDSDFKRLFAEYEEAVRAGFFPASELTEEGLLSEESWVWLGDFEGDNGDFLSIGDAGDDGYPLTIQLADQGEYTGTAYVDFDKLAMSGTVKNEEGEEADVEITPDAMGIVVLVVNGEDKGFFRLKE